MMVGRLQDVPAADVTVTVARVGVLYPHATPHVHPTSSVTARDFCHGSHATPQSNIGIKIWKRL